MKKVLLFAAVLMATFGAKAQDSQDALTYGVKAGVNISNVTLSGNGISASASSKVGFLVGGFAEFGVAKNFYIQPGLEYTVKGTKEGPVTINLGYLELPIMAVYKFPVTNAAKITLNAGPYVAYGIAGKADDGAGNSVNSFSDLGGTKNFDFGVGIGVGAEYNSFLLNVGYEAGLTNIDKNLDASNPINVKNTNVLITLGYRF